MFICAALISNPPSFETCLKTLGSLFCIVRQLFSLAAPPPSFAHDPSLDLLRNQSPSKRAEPLIRLNLEGLTPEIMEKRRDEVLGIIRD